MTSPLAETPDGTEGSTIVELLGTGAIQSVFQPIVDLTTGDVVAYEALARGPVGPLESPTALFDAARRAGVLPELDEACRAAAFRAARDRGLLAPLTVFVNVEPEVLDGAPLSELLAIADSAPGELRIVLEITERALTTRPAELLRTVERVRGLGWGVALDDVGAEAASLAFMSLLRPDVVKLDMALIQDQPGQRIAEVMNAVNAYAERTGALILAEGIEIERHLSMARALGASLGQGWYFGRPTPAPQPHPASTGLSLPSPTGDGTLAEPVSPFACLPAGTVLKQASKRLLVAVSKQLEREALGLGETCVVASTFQYREHFTAATAARYRELVDHTGFVAAIGAGLSTEPIPGLCGASLQEGDPVLGEWDVAVLSPHFSCALLARDLGDTGPDMDRTFAYALTYNRETVTAATHQLLLRVQPRSVSSPVVPGVATSDPIDGADIVARTDEEPRADAVGVLVTTGEAEAFLPLGEHFLTSTRTLAGDAAFRRALGASMGGMTITDMTSPDQPLLYANEAFGRLAGFSTTDLLHRNCRVLQGPDTDPAAVARIRAAVSAGQECRELLLNYRGPDRTPWWNELHLSPVRDDFGRVVQYIGVQNDVTLRVQAEQGLVLERDRAFAFSSRLQKLAYTDSLTGLMNRRRFEDRFESALLEAQLTEKAVALLFLDLDGFKAVNDSLGHPAGDTLLTAIAGRLTGSVRSTDLLARFGGDEFLIGLSGLDADTAIAGARQVAGHLAAVVAEPVLLRAGRVEVSASIGSSIFPDDADSFGQLLHLADLRMYQHKHPTSVRRGD